MIYILVGNDTNKKNIYLKKLFGISIPVKLSSSEVSRKIINEYASSQSLFGDISIVSIENALSKGEISLSKDDLTKLSDSKNIFVFNEDKLLASEEKKYIKYAARIEHFTEKKVNVPPSVNTFAIADSFAQHDKIGTWILYNKAIESGIAPEAVSGILFWKIKTMILNGTKTFTIDNLKKQSSEIVSIYHKAHRGEIDLSIGLEQFILSSLNK